MYVNNIIFAISMHKSIRALFFLMLVCSQVLAQQTPHAIDLRFEEQLPVLTYHEKTYGLFVHTAGWGLTYRRGIHKTATRTQLLDFAYATIKHPKEVKLQNIDFPQAKAFVYGKLNSLYVLDAGVGEQRILFQKAEQSGVAMKLHYSGGLAFGFAKPIYLIVYNNQTTESEDVLIKQYKPGEVVLNDIIGKASFSYGATKMKFYPGIYAKCGATFEWGVYDDAIREIELGVMSNLFFKKVPIMAYNPAQRAYVSFYLTFMIGKQW